LEKSLSNILAVEGMYSDDNNLSFFSMANYNRSLDRYSSEDLESLRNSILYDIDNDDMLIEYSAVYENLNLSKNIYMGGFTRGVYGIESHETEPFVWLEPESRIYLRHGDTNAKTIDIDIRPTIYGYAHATSPTFLGIRINGISGVEEPLTDSSRRIISIDTSVFSDIVQDSGLYKIEILTDGVYNPYKAGDSSDNRDLALQLFGISVY
jgi:hypothetical protein